MSPRRAKLLLDLWQYGFVGVSASGVVMLFWQLFGYVAGGFLRFVMVALAVAVVAWLIHQPKIGAEK